MNKSKCPVCGSRHTIKYGIRAGVQTYKCADCGYRFRNSRLPSGLDLWKMYQERKQTVAELAASLGTSPSTIKRRLRDIVIEWEQPPLSGHGFVHLDATYRGRNDGILAAMDSRTGKVLYLSFIRHERVSDYQDAVDSITERGYVIDGIVVDGIRALFSLFPAYRTQMCQFHMRRIVRRYVTQSPRLPAARELDRIMAGLARMKKEVFLREYAAWKETWKDALSRRSQLKDGRTRYRHRRLRSAVRSIDFHLPYLFTFQEAGCEGMPNTNNRIEGVFSDLKKNLNNHCGMNGENRRRFVCGFFKALE